MSELINILNNLEGTYYDFVVAISQYCKRKPARLELVLNYLKDNPSLTADDVSEFVVSQPDFQDDNVISVMKNVG